jgi:hypothetical protein
MINEILNGDSASEIRAKLNEMITIVNYYSSSQFVGGPAPGGGGEPYNPPPSDAANIWSSGGAMPFPSNDAQSACNTIGMMSSHTVYITKDPANMGGTAVIEVNDYLYTDSMKTSAVSSGYYGYRDTSMMNKFISVDMMGRVIEMNHCV